MLSKNRLCSSAAQSQDRQQNIHRQRPVVYLVCFEQPYVAQSGNTERKVRHYLGWTINLDKRVKLHASNQGARLLAVVNDAGISWRVVRLWENGSYSLERKLKRRHNHAQLCPVCNQRIRHLLFPEQKGSPGIPSVTEADRTNEGPAFAGPSAFGDAAYRATSSQGKESAR